MSPREAARRASAAVALALLLLCTGVQAAAATPRPSPTDATASTLDPILAYFYAGSGSTKPDSPQDLRQQILAAQRAGIAGFILDWQDSAAGKAELLALIPAATQQHFSLAISYHATTADGRALPAARVAADLRWFADRFASNPVLYRMGGRALVILHGSWRYDHQDLALITSGVRARLAILADEPSVTGYQAVADVIDGNAPDTSNVDPVSDHAYPALLTALGRAAHADGNYWMAPLAPGFDAAAGRATAGRQPSVDRRDGATLLASYNVAVRSAPDLLGLMSWNDVAEGTYVQASARYGTRSLAVLADITGTHPPVPASAVDSSTSLPGAPARSGLDLTALLLVVPVALGVALAAIGVLLRKRARGWVAAELASASGMTSGTAPGTLAGMSAGPGRALSPTEGDHSAVSSLR